MITRELDPSEWNKLAFTDARGLWEYLDPAWASVLVVEDGETIIGACVVMTVLHPECFWVEETHRGHGQVAHALWDGIQAQARAAKMRTVAAAAVDDEMRSLLTHLGAVPLPGDHYVLAVKES